MYTLLYNQLQFFHFTLSKYYIELVWLTVAFNPSCIPEADNLLG